MDKWKKVGTRQEEGNACRKLHTDGGFCNILQQATLHKETKQNGKGAAKNHKRGREREMASGNKTKKIKRRASSNLTRATIHREECSYIICPLDFLYSLRACFSLLNQIYERYCLPFVERYKAENVRFQASRLFEAVVYGKLSCQRSLILLINVY